MYETYKKAVEGFKKEIDTTEDIVGYDELSEYLEDKNKNKLFVDQIYPDSPFELCQEKIIEQFRSLALAMIDGEILVTEGRRKSRPKGKCTNLEQHLLGDCFECKKIDGYNQALEDSLSHLRSEREKIANEK